MAKQWNVEDCYICTSPVAILFMFLAVTTSGCFCIGAPTRRHFASGWPRATRLAGCFAPVKMQGGWVDSKISLSKTNLSPNAHTRTNLTFYAKAPNNISLNVSTFFIINLRTDLWSIRWKLGCKSAMRACLFLLNGKAMECRGLLHLYLTKPRTFGPEFS